MVVWPLENVIWRWLAPCLAHTFNCAHPRDRPAQWRPEHAVTTKQPDPAIYLGQMDKNSPQRHHPAEVANFLPPGELIDLCACGCCRGLWLHSVTSLWLTQCLYLFFHFVPAAVKSRLWLAAWRAWSPRHGMCGQCRGAGREEAARHIQASRHGLGYHRRGRRRISIGNPPWRLLD